MLWNVIIKHLTRLNMTVSALCVLAVADNKTRVPSVQKIHAGKVFDQNSPQLIFCTGGEDRKQYS
jgi:hypothetical protein